MLRMYRIYVSSEPLGPPLVVDARTALEKWQQLCEDFPTEVVKLTSRPGGLAEREAIEAIGYSGAAMRWIDGRSPSGWKRVGDVASGAF